MKQTAIGLLVFIICALFLYFFFSQQSKTISPLDRIPFPSEQPTITPVVQERSSSLFVPYWSFTKAIDTEGFDTILYFGISANANGVDTNDVGYKKLEQFASVVDGKEKLLVVRMINSESNSKVLDNRKTQQKIIEESIAIATKYGFTGIVFDFEINALAFPSVVSNITNFYKSFYTKAKNANLSFSITIYGDTFYRARPYDMKAIAGFADTIYIMAYDFHKSRGNPGPNFPLFGKETYGYDMESLLDDFSKNIPLEKVTTIFGLFGYDWTVDDKKQSINAGVPLSFAEINKKYLQNCTEKDCVVKRDSTSLETEITYTDEDGGKHVIWFEDLESMKKKKAFLQTKGLNATAVWAYSYY